MQAACPSLHAITTGRAGPSSRHPAQPGNARRHRSAGSNGAASLSETGAGTREGTRNGWGSNYPARIAPPLQLRNPAAERNESPDSTSITHEGEPVLDRFCREPASLADARNKHKWIICANSPRSAPLIRGLEPAGVAQVVPAQQGSQAAEEGEPPGRAGNQEMVSRLRDFYFLGVC